MCGQICNLLSGISDLTNFKLFCWGKLLAQLLGVVYVFVNGKTNLNIYKNMLMSLNNNWFALIPKRRWHIGITFKHFRRSPTLFNRGPQIIKDKKILNRMNQWESLRRNWYGWSRAANDDYFYQFYFELVMLKFSNKYWCLHMNYINGLSHQREEIK